MPQPPNPFRTVNTTQACDALGIEWEDELYSAIRREVQANAPRRLLDPNEEVRSKIKSFREATEDYADTLFKQFYAQLPEKARSSPARSIQALRFIIARQRIRARRAERKRSKYEVDLESSIDRKASSGLSSRASIAPSQSSQLGEDESEPVYRILIKNRDNKTLRFRAAWLLGSDQSDFTPRITLTRTHWEKLLDGLRKEGSDFVEGEDMLELDGDYYVSEGWPPFVVQSYKDEFEFKTDVSFSALTDLFERLQSTDVRLRIAKRHQPPSASRFAPQTEHPLPTPRGRPWELTSADQAPKRRKFGHIRNERLANDLGNLSFEDGDDEDGYGGGSEGSVSQTSNPYRPNERSRRPWEQ